MTLILLILAFVQQKVEEHMYSVKFRSIKVGLGSIFASLLLLLGLFTLTGTASAHTAKTLHTHVTATSAVIGATCTGDQVSSVTFKHSRHNKAPKYSCTPDAATGSCTGDQVYTITFHHSHKKELPSYSCIPSSGH